MLVATYHCFLPLMVAGSIVHRLFGRGYLYVDLFFVLSGYVMALNYGPMFSRRITRGNVVSFLGKRLARVYPLYVVVTVAMALGYWVAYGDFADHHSWIDVPLAHPALQIPLNLALLQAWTYSSGIVGQAWSISTEAAAYLVFPLIALWYFRWRPLGLCGAVLCSFAVIPLAVVMAQGDGLYHAGTLDIWTGPPALLRCFGGFSLGVCLFRIAAWKAARILFTDAFGLSLLAVYAVLLLGRAPDLAVYPVLPLLVLCLAGNKGWVGAAFGCRPVYVLGLLSYSLYLLHVYFIPPMYALARILSGSLPLWLAWSLASVAAVSAMLSVSTLAYLGVEKPARRLLRQAFARRPAGHRARDAGAVAQVP